jgi:hypothetical protein
MSSRPLGLESLVRRNERSRPTIAQQCPHFHCSEGLFDVVKVHVGAGHYPRFFNQDWHLGGTCGMNMFVFVLSSLNLTSQGLSWIYIASAGKKDDALTRIFCEAPLEPFLFNGSNTQACLVFVCWYPERFSSIFRDHDHTIMHAGCGL